MTYHRIFNMTGATSEAGSAHPSAAHTFTLVFREVRFTQSLVFCVFFYRPLFVFLSFFFWSLYLSVFPRFTTFSFGHCIVCLPRFKAFDYPFDLLLQFVSKFNI